MRLEDVRINEPYRLDADPIVNCQVVAVAIDSEQGLVDVVDDVGDRYWATPEHLSEKELLLVGSLLSRRSVGSINEWVSRHPVLTPYLEVGMVLHLQRMGLVVVPIERTGKWSWDCQVIVGNETYPPSGYRLSVGADELRRAQQIHLEVPS